MKYINDTTDVKRQISDNPFNKKIFFVLFDTSIVLYEKLLNK